MRWIIGCALVVLVPACGGSRTSGSGDFPVEPLVTLASTSGALRLELRTSPQPPSRASGQRAEYIVTDAAGGSVPGLAMDVLPWMPVMGHGTSVVPSITETAPGKFEIDNLYFFMPGLWALRTTLSTSGSQPDAANGADVSSDYVEPSFEIP